MIKTTIYVEPVSKGRVRVLRKGGRSFAYTPHATAHAESLIREHVIAHVLKVEQSFGDKVPLYLEATFFRLRPKHLPKRVTLPVTRPDLDNYTKLLTDALEKFVYANDSQITTAVIKKRFGDPPRIELLMKEDV